MANTGKVKIGLIGSQFQADIHATSLQSMPHEAEIVAVASPTPGNAEKFAKHFKIAKAYTDYREMLKDREIEMVSICAPNSLHAQMTEDIAAAGKHVMVEKPLAMTIAEGEEMIAVTKKAGVLLMYGEELLFTPKYLKVKEMADAGAFGKVYLVKQSEKHFGPHSDWFWDVNRSGGGAFMDLGCHGIAFCYWFLGRSPIKSVYCQMGTYVHGAKTQADDDCLCILEFREWRRGLDREQLGPPRRHGRQNRSVRRSWMQLRELAHGERDADIQREGLRLRGRESSHHKRLDLSGLRGALELRYAPRVDALCEGACGARKRCNRPAKTGWW